MCLSFHPVKPSWIVGGTFNGTYCWISSDEYSIWITIHQEQTHHEQIYIWARLYWTSCWDVASDIPLIIKLLWFHEKPNQLLQKWIAMSIDQIWCKHWCWRAKSIIGAYCKCTMYENTMYQCEELWPDFPLTLARWPMASEHCRRTSDFLSYWPGLASGISKIAEK